MDSFAVTHLYLSISGLILFVSIYFASRWLSSRLLPKSISGNNGNKVGYEETVVAVRSVSFVAGVVCGATGLYVLYEVDNILYGRSKILMRAACFVYTYFIFDIIVMFHSFCRSRSCRESDPLCSKFASFVSNNLLMVIHHMVLIVLTIPFCEGSMRSYFGDYYVGFLFLMEISTPLLSLHFILDNVGFKDSLVQQINGVIFLVIFFLVRVASFPYMYWIYAHKFHNNKIIPAMYNMYWFCHSSMVAFFTMQFLWFIAASKKVLRGATRIYSRARHMSH